MSMLIISQTLPFTGKQSEFTHSFKYYFLCSNFLFIRKFVHFFVTFFVQAKKVNNKIGKKNINLAFLQSKRSCLHSSVNFILIDFPILLHV